MTAEEELRLLRRYEPIVRYNRGELFLPCAIDGYLAHAALYRRAGRSAEQLAAPGALDCDKLAAAGVDVLGLTGVGLMLLSGTRLDCVAVSDEATGDIEALELMVGEGPCLDAFRTGTACFDENLADDRERGGPGGD